MGRIILSICAVVVALGLAGASAQKAASPQAGQPGDAGQTEGKSEPPPPAARSNGQDQARDETAEEANEIARRDLKAQRAMAYIALLQMILTGGGLFLIWETLKETRKAVVEAGDATEAAHEAVDVTRLVGEAQVRAYLSVIGINFTAETDDGVFMVPRPKIELVVNNSGTTPANHIAYFCGCECLTIQQARAFVCPEKVRFLTRLPTVPANTTERADAAGFAYLAAREAYEEGREAFTQDTKMGELPVVVVWVSLIYDDVFGRTYRSDAAFMCEPIRRSVGERLKVLDAPQRTFEPLKDRANIVDA